MADAHLFVDIHRLFADRAAADDQRFKVFAAKGTDPLGGRLAEPAVLVNQGIVCIKVGILCHGFNLHV